MKVATVKSKRTHLCIRCLIINPATALYRWPGTQIGSLKLCTQNLSAVPGMFNWADVTPITTSPPSSPSLSSPSSANTSARLFTNHNLDINLLSSWLQISVVTQPCSTLPCFWAPAVLYLTERRGLKESNRKSKENTFAPFWCIKYARKIQLPRNLI